MKKLGRIVLFAVSLLAFYVAAVGAATFLKIDGLSVVERVTRTQIKPGEFTYALTQFREIDEYQDVDVLLLGSSHAAHGFDVRVFREADLEVFNLGMLNQTPVASHHMLRRYWSTVEPCMVVFETYPGMLARSHNMEILTQIVVSTPPSWRAVWMALAEKRFSALNIMLSAYWSQLREPLSQVEQHPTDDFEYIAGGFRPIPDTVATIDTTEDYDSRYEVAEKQVDHVRRIIQFVQSKGVPIVLVTHPLPEELRQTIENYDAVVDRIRTTAEEEGAPYLDFNEILSFETHAHFSDENHLNAAGARIFSRALLQELQALGYSCLDDARTRQVTQMPGADATTAREQ